MQGHGDDLIGMKVGAIEAVLDCLSLGTINSLTLTFEVHWDPAQGADLQARARDAFWDF